MTYNREVEKKFVVSAPLIDVWLRILKTFPTGEILSGRSTDTFWKQPGVDFIRLRKNTSELSVKVTDKHTIEDRVEENIVVADFDTAARFATAVFGPEVGTLEKNYRVLTTPTFVIALYTVTGYDQVYLEVESENLEIVTEVSLMIQEHFTMCQEMRSLFQIIFGEV